MNKNMCMFSFSNPCYVFFGKNVKRGYIAVPINIDRNFIITWKSLGKNFTVHLQYYDIIQQSFVLKLKLINLLVCRPCGLCSKYSVGLLYHKSSYRQYRNQWAWLRSNTTFLFFMKTGDWLVCFILTTFVIELYSAYEHTAVT